MEAPRKVAVYDIVNCGPRNRFMANGKLVHNSGGYNVQNMKRGGTLRQSIHAPDGYVLLVADLSGIELRTARGLANDVQAIDMFRKDEDLYCLTAGRVYGNPVYKEGHEFFQPYMAEQRQVGKVSDLSLQYGAGKTSFQGMLRVMAGIRWGEEHCAATVDAWRAVNNPTTSRWRAADAAIRAMAMGNAPMNWNIDTAGGKPVFWFEEKAILLPRGLRIKYPNLHQREVMDKEKAKWLKTEYVYTDKRSSEGLATIYGGKVFENLCQAIATAIYLEMVINVNRITPVLLSVHDEIVLMIPADQAEQYRSIVKLIMSKSPLWWPDLPLKVSIGIAKSYGDAK